MTCNADFQSCSDIPSGAYSGLATDGQSLLTSGEYEGEQVGVCGGTLTEDFLQMPTTLTLTGQEVTELREHFGVDAGTDTVILNVEASSPGNVCIDMSQQIQVRSVIDQMASQGTCLFSGDDNTRCVVMESLQRAYRSKYGEDAPRTWTQSISHYAEEFGGEAALLFGIALVFGKVVPWLQGPRGPGGGPGGPGNPTGNPEAPTEPVGDPEPRTGQRRVERVERRHVEVDNPWYEDVGWAILGTAAAVGTVAAVISPFDGLAGDVALGSATVGSFAQVGAATAVVILVTTYEWEDCTEGEAGCIVD